MTSSFAAELWGLREGLILCCNLNITSFEIEVGAKFTVDALGNPLYVNDIISPLLDDCRLLIFRMLQICIKHCFCQANDLIRMSFCLDANFSPFDRTLLMFLRMSSMECILTGLVMFLSSC